MKKFLIKCLIFILIVYAVDLVLYFILPGIISATLYDDRLEKVVDGKMDADIVILGSSRAARDIIACDFQKEIDRNAFNLGFPGSNVDFHETVMRIYLERNKTPKIVIIVLDQSEIIDNPSINFRLDKLYPLAGDKEIDRILEYRENDPVSYTDLFFSSKYKKNFPKSFYSWLYIPKTDTLTECGSMPLSFKSITYEGLTYEDSTLYDPGAESPYLTQRFQSLLDMCKKNGVKVLLVAPPSFYRPSPGFYSRMMQFTEYEHVIFFAADEEKYTDKKLFYDKSHLDKEGAEMFTGDVIYFIKKDSTLSKALNLNKQ